MSGWGYRFPEHVDARSISRTDASLKVLEEAGELFDAVHCGECRERVAEECLDTIHACETLLRRWSPEWVSAQRDAVEEKNRARGYYGEEE